MIGYTFEDINDALPVLMRQFAKAPLHGSRVGTTRELRHVGITLMDPTNREILLGSRKANIAAQIVETAWVLAGRNDIAGILPYLPRAADFSDDGRTWRAGYGPRIRNFHGVDQLDAVVELLKADPDTRRAVISLWNPVDDSQPGKDIACNNWLSFSARNGLLDLHVAVRSNDAMWGWSGINAFEWSVLLEVVAALTGLATGQLHFSTTSFHLYEQHWDKAVRIGDDYDATVGCYSPLFGGLSAWTTDDLDALLSEWFELEELIRTGRHEPSAVDAFPEPMLRSWLRVLQWYWSGNEAFLELLNGDRLAQACLAGVKPAGTPQVVASDEVQVPEEPLTNDPFLVEVNRLHAEKHAAYGDSWKRRGEPGILGNIARKVDRIGSGQDTSDETQADTAMDLMVYLAKYRCWMDDPEQGGQPAEVEQLLYKTRGSTSPVLYIHEDFDILERCVHDDYDKVIPTIDRLLAQAMTLARSLWKG